MLNSILKDPRLNSKEAFSIILLPPHNSTHTPFLFDYLASHVIHLPLRTSLNSIFSRSKLTDKKKKSIVNHSSHQLLFPLNENIIYKTSNGFIIHDSKKVKICHCDFLYTNLENDICTHMILYMDDSIIFKNELTTIIEQQQQLIQPTDLCFKEMVKTTVPNNSIEVISKIDKLVLEFCDTSVNCDSLKSLHDCMENILEDGYNLIETLDTTNIGLDVVFGSFESYIMDSTYDVAFFKITQLLLDNDKKLAVALEDMEHLDFSQIGLPSSIIDQRNRVHNAISEFERIGSFRTPAEKLDCLLNTVSELTRDADSTCAFLDSDSLIPLLLITLIRSKVPHLTANLIYMKEYTFERNIVTGKYGYALSTFEGVLEYIMNAHTELSKISKQNLQYWSAIETGDLDQVIRYNTTDAHDTRDVYGNNALMIACIHHQHDIIKYLLSITVRGPMINDMKTTPLMLAIQYGKSLETIKLLLTDPHVIQSVNHAIDKHGNTAILYACAINNIDILKVLVQVAGPHLDQHVNTITGDTMLHVASKNACSVQVMSYIMKHYQHHTMKNKKLETFYHVCQNFEFLKHLLDQEEGRHYIMYYLIQDVDEKGRSPFMTWAFEKKLNLVAYVVSINANANSKIHYGRVDHHGNTVLHLLAMHTGKSLIFGDKSLDYMIEQFKDLIHIREWIHGNTPLHLVAEISILASAYHVNNAMQFIKALVKHGASIDAVNYKDEHPVNLCRFPELIQCLDELHLKMHAQISPANKKNVYHFVWQITRSSIEQGEDKELYYIIKSGQIDKPESMRIVKRRLQDFIFLRQELLYEMPETFLPTFQNVQDPLLVDLKPPPLPWIDLTMTRLQSFMNWLQYHPVLCYHDLVISFVRSLTDLQPSLIRDNSFSRRKLLLEKISDLPLPHCVTNTVDEQYFLTYAQEMMMPLKSGFLNALITGHKMMHINKELENEMSLVAKDIIYLKSSGIISPLAVETIQICANLTGDRSHVSLWPELIKASQMAHDMIDGILISLQRPFSLLNQRGLLREKIEQQKETLGKSNWHHGIFTSKKHAEKEKESVIQDMNELNYIDGQINQSHKMISDELAHFQTIHPKQIIKTIKSISRSRLMMEKQKLVVLEQTLYKWNSSNVNNNPTII